MKYFTNEVLETGKDFERICGLYREQLKGLRALVSKQAWEFFYLGFGRWGLHDASILRFSAGDGLNYLADGRTPFRINKRRTAVEIQILNRHQNLLYTFACNSVRKIVFDYAPDDPPMGWKAIDDINTYELTSGSKAPLSLEFLFVSEATILVEFARLKFSRRRVRRQYDSSEAYA